MEEIKLTISIESPDLIRESRSITEIEASREEVASAFMDVVTGKIPKHKAALKVLASEIENWSMIEQDSRGNLNSQTKRMNVGLVKKSGLKGIVLPEADSEYSSGSPKTNYQQNRTA